MTSINNVTLKGFLAAEPELRETKTGHRTATLIVATNHTTRDGRKFTNYHRVIAWNHFADLAKEHAKKGSLVQLEGRITYRSYEAADGSKRRFTEIFAVHLEVITGAEANEQSGPPAEKPEPEFQVSPKIREALDKELAQAGA